MPGSRQAFPQTMPGTCCLHQAKSAFGFRARFGYDDHRRGVVRAPHVRIRQCCVLPLVVARYARACRVRACWSHYLPSWYPSPGRYWCLYRKGSTARPCRFWLSSAFQPSGCWRRLRAVWCALAFCSGGVCLVAIKITIHGEHSYRLEVIQPRIFRLKSRPDNIFFTELRLL